MEVEGVFELGSEGSGFRSTPEKEEDGYLCYGTRLAERKVQGTEGYREAFNSLGSGFPGKIREGHCQALKATNFPPMEIKADYGVPLTKEGSEP